MKKEELIQKLDMKPLQGEGGYYHELYRSKDKTNGISNCGTTLYMLTSDTFSCMHKLSIDETYYYHDGPALEMLLIYEDHSEIIKIGKDISNNEYPQFTIPAGVWQGSHMIEDGEYTLVSTSMAPAFEASTFELGTYELLKDKTEHLDLLKILTK